MIKKYIVYNYSCFVSKHNPYYLDYLKADNESEKSEIVKRAVYADVNSCRPFDTGYYICDNYEEAKQATHEPYITVNNGLNIDYCEISIETAETIEAFNEGFIDDIETEAIL